MRSAIRFRNQTQKYLRSVRKENIALIRTVREFLKGYLGLAETAAVDEGFLQLKEFSGLHNRALSSIRDNTIEMQDILTSSDPIDEENEPARKRRIAETITANKELLRELKQTVAQYSE